MKNNKNKIENKNKRSRKFIFGLTLGVASAAMGAGYLGYYLRPIGKKVVVINETKVAQYQFRGVLYPSRDLAEAEARKYFDSHKLQVYTTPGDYLYPEKDHLNYPDLYEYLDEEEAKLAWAKIENGKHNYIVEKKYNSNDINGDLVDKNTPPTNLVPATVGVEGHVYNKGTPETIDDVVYQTHAEACQAWIDDQPITAAEKGRYDLTVNLEKNGVMTSIKAINKEEYDFGQNPTESSFVNNFSWLAGTTSGHQSGFKFTINSDSFLETKNLNTIGEEMQSFKDGYAIKGYNKNGVNSPMQEYDSNFEPNEDDKYLPDTFLKSGVLDTTKITIEEVQPPVVGNSLTRLTTPPNGWSKYGAVGNEKYEKKGINPGQTVIVNGKEYLYFRYTSIKDPNPPDTIYDYYLRADNEGLFLIDPATDKTASGWKMRIRPKTITQAPDLVLNDLDVYYQGKDYSLNNEDFAKLHKDKMALGGYPGQKGRYKINFNDGEGFTKEILIQETHQSGVELDIEYVTSQLNLIFTIGDRRNDNRTTEYKIQYKDTLISNIENNFSVSGPPTEPSPITLADLSLIIIKPATGEIIKTEQDAKLSGQINMETFTEAVSVTGGVPFSSMIEQIGVEEIVVLEYKSFHEIFIEDVTDKENDPIEISKKARSDALLSLSLHAILDIDYNKGDSVNQVQLLDKYGNPALDENGKIITYENLEKFYELIEEI